MSMRDTDLIHGLTFDFAFAAMSADSVELADWVKADLLPVVEEVLDQYRGMRQRRRIERLEIDLGTVSAVQARSELTRRLFVQLSIALEESLDEAGAADKAGDRAQGPGGDMLEFLRSGTMPWATASDANEAHKKLLRQVIDSPHAHEVLSVALREAHMLTRLIRQFDAQELLAAAGALFTTWTAAERAAALAWAFDEQRRLQDAEGDAESFWRWFLPQYAHPASPDTLLTRWNQACRGEPAAAPQAKATASTVAIARFTARAMSTIEQGLESADFALLAPYWDRILSSAPQCLRSAHPRLWKLWLKEFDADTLADILGVMQADCCWLIECLATVVPRPRLNALLRPAMQQWLAEPVDSLAPHLVLEWVKVSVPEQSGRIDALFAAHDAGEGPQEGAPARAANNAMIRQSDEQLPSTARDLFTPWQAQAQASVPIMDSASLTPSEMSTIEQGLETADFALLAPYWDRILSSAQQRLRAAHPRLWERWLRNFDDDTLTDIVGVVQADCSWLIGSSATVVPRARHNAQLRPALQRWLAAPIDSLAPQEVLEWVKASVPEQSDRFLALFAAQQATQRAQEREPARAAGSAIMRQSDAQLLSTAHDLVKPSPQAQRDAAKVQANLAAMASASFTPSEMRTIEQGLETADFALLAPYWGRVLSSAPQWLRTAHSRLWKQWLHNFDDDTLTDILGVVQADCAWLIERLATVVPRPRLSALLRPALQQWLAAPADSLAPQEVLAWVAALVPDQSDRILALFAAEKAALEPQGREPVVSASGAMIRQSDAQMLSTARVLFRPWPQAQRDAMLAWAGEELRRLHEAGSDSVAFWRWLLPQCAKPVSLSALVQQWFAKGDRGLDPGATRVPRQTPLYLLAHAAQTPADALADAMSPRALAALLALDETGHGLPPSEVSRAYEQLCAALREPQAFTRLARQLSAQQLLTAARVLFKTWPQAERKSALAWAADEQQRLHDAGGDVESFWRWFLPLHAHPTALDALVRSYTTELERDERAAQAQTDAVALASSAAIAPAMLAALFAPDEAAVIRQGLATAQFHLLAPHWDRLLTRAPQWICAEHPQLWRKWLATFNDDVLMDILLVVQADCKPMLEGMTALIPRELLLPLMRPALPAWFGAAPHRLSPRVMLMHVMKGAPQHADALSALFYEQEPGAGRAAGGQHAAVDSKHFREPLRVLGPIFARAEIITISKCLNAGEFQLLAPYWDRLLVLAPHWLRSEYPRLARTWLAGFDDEVLIDILSVVQAECCALIERLASALPREQLHAALRPSLARWFDVGLDRLAPQAIMEEVLRATPGNPAGLQAMLGAPVSETVQGAAIGADPVWLEEVLERGDVAQLRRIWPSIVISQRAQFRRIWAQLSSENRNHAIERFTTQLSLAQQLDVALILQPAVAMLMAELRRFLGERPDRGDILGTALRFLLHADVASAVPERLMHCVLEKHMSLPADLPFGETRHIAAALQSFSPAPAGLALEEQGAALASAQLSEDALRAYVADCRREEAQFGQLNSAQLHGLVQAWAGFQQASEASGAFLSAIEARALRAAAPHAFFGKVLQQAMLGETIDLDEIGAGCGAIAPAPFVLTMRIEDVAARQFDRDSPSTLVHSGASPLSELLCQALPQRLAEALLRADLSALDALWPDIVMHHPALLRQAAQRYLGRAEARNRLIGSADAGKMQDLLGCLSAWAAQLVAPLLDSAARFSVTLPTPLAPAAFQQRVLRFAFAQVMDRPASTEPAEWISGLLRSVLPAQSQQSESGFELVAHAWYELLRGGDTLLKAALEHALLGSEYLEVALRRLRTDARAGLETSLPEVLQHMLTMELCNSHPALTDQLLANGNLVDADATVFSAAEWQALARAQLPRQERAVQLAFWREFSARLPAPAANTGAGEEDVQAAFAAAFGVLKKPAWQAADAASLVPAPTDTALSAASADTIAILLMRESAPDDAAKAGIKLLTQRLLANADACADTTAHAALQSALSHHQVIGRLLAILPRPTLARLLCVLQPSLAGALPAVLRAISDILPIPLSAVPATLDSDIWRAIFEAIFTGRMPASAGALLGALVNRLASQHPQEGPAWLRQIDTLALAAAPAAAATPAGAMAQLLQPLAGPQPDKAAARAVRIDEERVPFTGDANLRNAGLVIIAPYIERLFALLDITKDGVFVSEEARQRGVHLLQYVITAEESTPEYLLALNKLLCGMPADVPVVLGISMTEKEKDTIDQMLKGVIAHWSAIGSSSVTGLRETFLQREGCLYYQEEAWHLKIPQRTFDMLLDRLPWGYKLIKFSWMAAPLNVTWR